MAQPPQALLRAGAGVELSFSVNRQAKALPTRKPGQACTSASSSRQPQDYGVGAAYTATPHHQQSVSPTP